MAELTRVLLLANVEHGQTNLMLAILHEMLLRRDVAVHIGSHPALEERLGKVLKDNASAYGSDVSTRVHFHKVAGPTMMEVFDRSGRRGAFCRSGLRGAPTGFKMCCDSVWAYEEGEYMQGYNSCMEIITAVDPAVILVDFGFMQGRDAAVNTGVPYIVMNTTSLSHVVVGLQPNGAALWKYPMYV